MKTTLFTLAGLVVGIVLGISLTWQRAFDAGQLAARQPDAQAAVAIVHNFLMGRAAKPESVEVHEWIAVPTVGVKAKYQVTTPDGSILTDVRSFFVAKGMVCGVEPSLDKGKEEDLRRENDLLRMEIEQLKKAK